MEEESDERLAELVGERNQQAFSILVRRHAQRFYRTAWRMSANTAEAEEIVQEAYLKLWERPRIWKPGKGALFTTWFTRIIINLAIDRNKKSRAVIMDLSSVIGQDPGQENNVMVDQRQARLEAAIQALPPRQRAALNLCYYEGFKNAEAAEVLGIKVKALESLLGRARESLRSQFKEQGDV